MVGEALLSSFCVGALGRMSMGLSLLTQVQSVLIDALIRIWAQICIVSI